MSRRVSTQYPGVYYRERSKGRVYEIAYTDSLGKRRFETVPGGLRDAQRALATVRERMHRGEKVAPSRLTVAELSEDYLRTQCTHLKPRTLEDYGYKVDHWIKPALGHLRVSACDKLAVQEFIAGMKARGHKAWTIRGCLTPLSGMFQYAVDRGWAAQNPVRQVDSKKMPRSDQGEMRILSSEEIAAVRRAATDTYRLLFEVAIFCGLRLGEILALLWSDIDWEKSQLVVRESKTAAGKRRVAIPGFLLKSLAQAAGTDGHVFLTKDGEPMKHRRVGRALEETLRRAKVPHVRFHDLRHTFASILIGEGLDVTYVSRQLGHSSPQVTLGIYSHLFDPERREQEARDALEARFAGVGA
jgi:integrase